MCIQPLVAKPEQRPCIHVKRNGQKREVFNEYGYFVGYLPPNVEWNDEQNHCPLPTQPQLA